ncbi:MAG: hypothetical protein K6E98_04025 [Lachnospiraceae bacterium]|nr:hypothetical protein [Lachnospiraceae bacterium]
MAKKGKLIQNGVHLQEHEYKSVKFFLDQGIDVELIPRSKVHNLRMPDISMNGVVWEVKAPIGDGKNNAQNTMKKAKDQSRNIIIDLQRCKMNDDRAVKEFEREFLKLKHLKRLKIIKKMAKRLTLKDDARIMMVQGVGLH